MAPVVFFIISQTILLPIIIGIVRFKTIKKEYFLLLVDLVLGLLTEVVSFILIRKYHASNAIPTNIFVLADWILLLYQFRQWGAFKKKGGFYLLLGIPVLIWLLENIVFKKIVEFSPYYRILYSFLLVLISINEVNFMIIHENKSLIKNPRFMIYIGFIIFFIYQIVYEWAYQLSLIEPTSFTKAVSYLFGYINAFAIIIFSIAFLLVPVYRKKFKLDQLLAE